MRGSIGSLASIAARERRSAAGRPRTPEPMAMNEPRSVADFHAGGALAGMRVVYELCGRCLDAIVPHGGRLLDLGVGSGRGLGHFLATRPDVTALGVDVAPAMLSEGRRFLDAAGVGDRASLVEGDLAALPPEVREQPWDAISSVWALHHLPDRDRLGAALREIALLRERDRGAVWIFDFQRLRHPDSYDALVSTLEPEASPVLRADGVASEAAAFTHGELREELALAGLGDLEGGMTRPVPWLQAFWGRAGEAAATTAQPTLRASASGGGDQADALQRSFSQLPA